MRQPITKLLTALFAIALTFGTAHVASADVRSDARTHYLAGQNAYSSGDYRTAITEFGAAQQLMPADLNSYNLALCYDKLGEAESAIQYYREYENRVPNTDKRAEIDASIARLDAAAKSAAAKRAADEAARRQPPPAPAPTPYSPPAPIPAPAPYTPAPTPSPYTPAPYTPGPTVAPAPAPTAGGDPSLDRINAIDINSIRNQRGGTQAPGPAVAGTDPNMGQGQPMNPNAPNGAQPNAVPGAPATAEVETPVYKKWWFWAVVGVSLYVVYEIATENSDSSTSRQQFARDRVERTGGGVPQAPQGLTLMRW
jgi:hypothetical protein